MAEFMGAPQTSRGDVTKKIWEYIKAQGLQDAANKRQINPDAKLAKLFGSNDSIDMFAMTKVLSKHFVKDK